MVIKPNELEQKAKEQINIDFKRRVTELEAKIDAHLIFFSNRIKQSGRAEYQVVTNSNMYGAEVVPKEVILETVRMYKDAGWEIILREQHDQTLLFFQQR